MPTPNGDPEYETFNSSLVKIIELGGLLLVGDMAPILGWIPMIKQAKIEAARCVANIRSWYQNVIEEEEKEAGSAHLVQ